MFEIKCYDGSVAYKYAVNNSIKYTIIEAPLLDISQAEISGIKIRIMMEFHKTG